MRKTLFLAGLAGLLVLGAANAHAQEYVLTIKDHRFAPTEIKVPGEQTGGDHSGQR
jgi:hypothetical protein